LAREYRTPYSDDALRVDNGTTPNEIQSFVVRRALNPIEISGVRIWNFNNHELNRDSLDTQVDGFMYDEYMIPFQASGVWGYMTQLLPPKISEVEILTYQQDTGKYIPFPNYIRHSENQDTDALRESIGNALESMEL